MSFVIIRGSNGRRHEVDFKDDPVAVDVSMSESVVQMGLVVRMCFQCSAGKS